VTIPPNTSTWEVTLSSSGESLLTARKDTIPDFVTTTAGRLYRQSPEGCEIEMKKVGPERFALLPPLGADLIPAGDYYLAVVGEGVGANRFDGRDGSGQRRVEEQSVTR
jgi:hypothetical protein